MSPPAVARVVRLGGLAGTGHQTGPGWTGTPAPPATSPQAGTDRPALPHPAGRVPAHLPDPRLGGLKRARRKTQKRQHVGLSFRIKHKFVLAAREQMVLLASRSPFQAKNENTQ